MYFNNSNNVTYLHTARNIPLLLNSMEYSPLEVIEIIPPDSAEIDVMKKTKCGWIRASLVLFQRDNTVSDVKLVYLSEIPLSFLNQIKGRTDITKLILITHWNHRTR